jgi:putative transposase
VPRCPLLQPACQGVVRGRHTIVPKRSKRCAFVGRANSLSGSRRIRKIAIQPLDCSLLIAHGFGCARSAVNLRAPKLRRQTFETAIIERYRRRESSVEEARIEMYLAGISVRRVEDITEALWSTRVSPSTVSNLNKKIYAKIKAWRSRRIEGEHPYLYLDGIVMTRTWAGEVRNVSLLVASAVNSGGVREIRGICEGAKEDKSGWSAFLRHLVDRGLKGVQLIISDACRGLMESVAEYLPDARWQRCMVHFSRNLSSHVPATKVREVSHMLKAIHAQESREATDRKARAIVDDLRGARMNAAADLVERSVQETLVYYAFPDIHWQKIRTNNPLERIMREIPPTNPCRRGVPGWSLMPQPGGPRASAAKRLAYIGLRNPELPRNRGRLDASLERSANSIELPLRQRACAFVGASLTWVRCCTGRRCFFRQTRR